VIVASAVRDGPPRRATDAITKTNLSPLGVDGLFAPETVDELLSPLDEGRTRAAA
jgi:hypothetical protein